MTQTWNRALILSVPVMKCRWVLASNPSVPWDEESWGETENSLGTLFSQWAETLAGASPRFWLPLPMKWPFRLSLYQILGFPTAFLDFFKSLHLCSILLCISKKKKNSKKEVHQLLQSLYCFFLRRSKGHRKQGHRCRSLKQQLHLSFPMVK